MRRLVFAGEVVIEFCGRCHRIPSNAIAVIRSALGHAPELSAELEAGIHGRRLPVVLHPADARTFLRAVDEALPARAGRCRQLDSLIAELRARFLVAEHAFLPARANFRRS
jgi:hypothetical protein